MNKTKKLQSSPLKMAKFSTTVTYETKVKIPVMDTSTGKVEISSQNHGLALATSSLPEKGTVITNINLNDNTVEGLVNEKFRAFSVQYHPKSSPGQHDSDYLFDRFIEFVKW